METTVGGTGMYETGWEVRNRPADAGARDALGSNIPERRIHGRLIRVRE